MMAAARSPTRSTHKPTTPLLISVPFRYERFSPKGLLPVSISPVPSPSYRHAHRPQSSRV